MSSRTVPVTTQYQRFLTESFDKEVETRLHCHKHAKGTEGKGSSQMEVLRKRIEAACPKPSDAFMGIEAVKPASFHRRKSEIIMPYPDKLERVSSINLDMKQPDSRTKATLYDGFTKQGKGRYQYLQARYNELPENKFQFPILSSWEFGWRLKDAQKKTGIKAPIHARNRIVRDTFYSRNGIPTLQRRDILQLL